MSLFVRHRVVFDPNRTYPSQPPFQLQVSLDGGETWQGVILKDAVKIEGGKSEPMVATVRLPLWDLEEGRFGRLVAGEHLPFEDPA